MAAPALSARAPLARARATPGGGDPGGSRASGSGLGLGGGETTEEELEALHQEHAAAVRCLRADYEARVQRGLELERLLEECDASLRERAEQASRDALAQEQLASRRLALEHLAMRREDVAVGAGALLEARQREVRRLEGRLADLRGDVGESWGPGRQSGAEGVQLPAPNGCAGQLAELRAAARAQEERADVLGADLRQVLQHVVRACTEPATPPGRPWPPREQPLREARQAMRLSEQGQAHLEDLLRRITPMNGGSVASAFGGAPGTVAEDGGLLRPGLLSPGPLPCSSLLGAALEVDAHRGPAEEENADDYDLRATFNEEAWLLHDRLASEARCVTKAIFSDLPVEAGGETASGSRAALLKGRDLHRAAALGDQAALLKALKARTPAVARAAGGGDTPLLGWTAWHSAAAHGHAAILEALDAHADNSLLHGLALDRRSAAGYPPLALACLHGHVEAVRWLLRLRSPVEVRDSRGNSPLLWAAAGDARWLSGSVSSSRRAIVQMLLDARADPEARNASGHSARALLDPELDTSPCSSLSGASPASSQNEVGRRPAAGSGDFSEDGRPSPPTTSLLGLASAEGPAAPGRGCHCIRTAGSAASEAEHHARASSVSSYLDFAMNMFASSDSAGFLGNGEAVAAAQLSHEERQEAVWSGWVRNFTHRGLRAALGACLSAAEPVFADRYRQVAALTCERLLLFDTAAGWTLSGVVALSEVSELLVPPQSDTMLLLRARRRPDVLLELAGPDARAELLDALDSAGQKRADARRRPSLLDDALGAPAPVSALSGPLNALLDENGLRVGTLAYVESDMLMLLPYAPQSLLLSGGRAMFFGFLDLQQGRAWRSFFFVLRGGRRGARRLLWCEHPNDERSVGSVPFESFRSVRREEMMVGGNCLVVELARPLPGPPQQETLVLRARSAQSCEEWITSLSMLRAAGDLTSRSDSRSESSAGPVRKTPSRGSVASRRSLASEEGLGVRKMHSWKRHSA